MKCKLYTLFPLALCLSICSAHAHDVDEDDFDYPMLDWNPDVTIPTDFGSGTLPDKFFSFEDLPAKKEESKGVSSLIAQEEAPVASPSEGLQEETSPRTILINFNNVAITEFIRFISRVSGKNFVYDDADLQFNVTIVSDEPATLDNVMAALMQVLRIHGLSLMEQGNNIIIHTNPKVNSISQIVADDQSSFTKDAEIVTQVFRLNTLDTEKAARLITPLVSESAIVDQLNETSNIVVTDIASNVQKIGQLLKSLDSPASGLIIGQYQVTNALIDSLIPMAEKIMEPIAEGRPLVFVPHVSSNSIFIVSTPFLVERSIAVLRHLDDNVGATRIFSDDNLRFSNLPPGMTGAGSISVPGGTHGSTGGGVITTGGSAGAAGQPSVSGFGTPGGPGFGTLQNGGGQHAFPSGLSTGTLGTQSNLEYLQRQQGFQPGSIGAVPSWSDSLPLGHIQRTQFYIQKLRFRKGQQITEALGRIAESLQLTGQSNADLVATIQSIQWIEASNSLVFTGTVEALLKVRELITEIDTPLRQVFIEMLILETTLDDSLTYGVNWGSRFGGGNQSGAQAFISKANPLASMLDTAGFNQGGQGDVLNTPDASIGTRQQGYSLGIIGRKLTKDGFEYASIGALVKAIHHKSKTNVVMNPKILTEDNVPAEIFVGINTQFQTQSIANDQGRIVTNNFEFRDVGTTLKVTPLLSNTDIITLEIKQEVSRVIRGTDTGGGGLTNQPTGPSTSKNTTTTRVHVPNKFFLVISGMIQEQLDRSRQQVPCLGGAPILGALASEKESILQKRNLMIFIRPEIIDTEEEVEHVTRHQQNVFRQKTKTQKMWMLEVDEAMDWMNVQKPGNCMDDREEYNP